MKAKIYLDHAAATPLDERVLAAMQPYFSETFYNPSATYEAARQTRKALEAARASIAHWFGARPSEITFTAGGTEANNLAILGVAQTFPGAHLVATQIEHDSVLKPYAELAKRGYKTTLVSPDNRGLIAPPAISKAVTDKTVLVSVGYVNNELGTIQPVRQIAAELQAIRDDRRQRGITTPLYLHTDACQAANYLDLHVSRLGVDLMTINGGKIYGPKQSGVLFVKAGLELQPQIFGGGQEHGLRSGTENVSAAIGLAKALDLVQTARHQEGERIATLQKLFFDQIETELPQAIINGSQKHRVPNNVHLTLPGHDNERLLIQLDEAGVQAAAGSACSASDEEPSHVLQAIGLSEADAQASLRFTMGHVTDEAVIAQTVKLLKQFSQP